MRALLRVELQQRFQDAIEILRPEEQKVIQAFTAHRADKPFDEGTSVGSTNGSLQDLHSLPVENCVNAGILAVAVSLHVSTLANPANVLDPQLLLPGNSPTLVRMKSRCSAEEAVYFCEICILSFTAEGVFV